MAFALTSVKVYPLEVEASFRKTYPHICEVALTALASDTALDLAALAAADTTNGPYLASILARADKILTWTFAESQRSAGSVVKTLTSAASAGGSPTETLTVTGLAVGDTILSVTPKVVGANAAAVRAFGTAALNSLSVTFTADPGAGATVVVAFLRAAGTANGSDHVFSGTAAAPVFTFAGGTSTPTALNLYLLIKEKPDYPPVRSTGT